MGRKRTIAADPYAQMGGYVKRCRGLNIYAKLENPPGHRIDRIFAGGKQLQVDNTFGATYVTVQGVPAKYGRYRVNLDLHAVDALRRWFAGNDPEDLTRWPSVVAVRTVLRRPPLRDEFAYHG